MKFTVRRNMGLCQIFNHTTSSQLNIDKNRSCKVPWIVKKGQTTFWFSKGLTSEKSSLSPFTPLEIMDRCSAAGLDIKIIPAGFNTPLEFLTGFTLQN
jgi:hypothetical protein